MLATSVAESSAASAVAARVDLVVGLFVAPQAAFVDFHAHATRQFFAVEQEMRGEPAQSVSLTMTDLVYSAGHMILEESAGLAELA